MSSDEFCCKPLSELEGVWRVDVPTELLQTNHNYSSPVRCQIHCTQIHPQFIESPFDPRAPTGKTTFITERFNRVSQLLIGSLWQDGKCIKRSTSAPRSMVINTANPRFYSVKPEKLNSFSLPDLAVREFTNVYAKKKANPEYKYDFWENKVGIHLFVTSDFDRSSGTTLIIPCSELYRFYFGVSSRFMNAAIEGQIHRYCKWENGMLRLEKRVSRMEAFVAHRGYATQAGRDWMLYPSDTNKQLAIAAAMSVSGEAAVKVIAAKFPFSDLTTLSYSGVDIVPADDSPLSGRKFVFVTELHQCTYNGDPDVHIAVSTYSKEPGEDGTSPLPVTPPPPDIDDEYEEPEENDDEPNDEDWSDNGHEFGNSIYLRMANKFSAMDGRKFNYHKEPGGPLIYEDPDGVTKFDENQRIPSADPDGYESADAESDNHTDDIGRDINDFLEMLKCLRKQVRNNSILTEEGWRVRTRATGVHSIISMGERVSAFSPLSEHPGKKWYLVPTENGGTQNRQLVCVEIEAKKKGKYVYCIERQLKDPEKNASTLIICKRDFSMMTDSELEGLFELTVLKSGWPTSAQKWDKELDKFQTSWKQNYEPNYTMARMSHPKSKENYQDDSKYFNGWAATTLQKLKNEFFNL